LRFIGACFKRLAEKIWATTVSSACASRGSASRSPLPTAALRSSKRRRRSRPQALCRSWRIPLPQAARLCRNPLEFRYRLRLARRAWEARARFRHGRTKPLPNTRRFSRKTTVRFGQPRKQLSLTNLSRNKPHRSSPPGSNGPAGLTENSDKDQETRSGPKPLWSDEEIEKLRALYPTHSASAIAEPLGRGFNAVRGKARSLGLKKDGPPT
jgi:hypothetical protein